MVAVAVVVGELDVVNVVVPAPLTCDHAPVPVVAVLPVIVEVNPHKVLSTPALEVVGNGLYVTITSSVLVQLPLVIVQRYV